MPAPTNALDRPQLATLHEAAHDLHVRAIPVVHTDQHDPVLLLDRTEDALYAGGRHPQWFLDQDMEVRRESGLDVGLMKMIGRADHHRIERLVSEQLLDVVEGVLDPEARCQGASLGQIGVADGLDVHTPHLLQHWQVRHLGDGTTTDDADLEALAAGSAPAGRHRPSLISSGAPNGSPESRRLESARRTGRPAPVRLRPTDRSPPRALPPYRRQPGGSPDSRSRWRPG